MSVPIVPVTRKMLPLSYPAFFMPSTRFSPAALPSLGLSAMTLNVSSASPAGFKRAFTLTTGMSACFAFRRDGTTASAFEAKSTITSGLCAIAWFMCWFCSAGSKLSDSCVTSAPAASSFFVRFTL